jgi:hypothetical protein
MTGGARSSGKDFEMYEYTDEEMKGFVARLGGKHREAFNTIVSFAGKYGVTPQLTMLTERIGSGSKIETMEILMQLVSAGCLISRDGGSSLVPLIPPEEAACWCGDKEEDLNACERILTLAVIEYSFRHDGELPRREELTEPYAASPLYSVIQKRADYLISTRFSRYDDTRQGVSFTERRKQEFRNLLSQMEVLPTA